MTPLTSTAGLEPGDVLRVIGDAAPDGTIVTFEESDFNETELRFREGDGLSWMASGFTLIGRPDAEGWIKHDGSENPVPGQMVEYRMRDLGSDDPRPSDVLRWSHRLNDSDITHFRLATPEPVSKSAETGDGDLVERLLAIATTDHERGCDGRCYSCSCGWDEETAEIANQAATEIARLRAEVGRGWKPRRREDIRARLSPKTEG